VRAFFKVFEIVSIASDVKGFGFICLARISCAGPKKKLDHSCLLMSATLAVSASQTGLTITSELVPPWEHSLMGCFNFVAFTIHTGNVLNLQKQLGLQ
jgi:hypothetical protein